ncbi:unnamed protein product [Effrenium voratum]|uniref:Uncharacterized protein n=1 Tax=Effrenium voratum TaxID=2562239 RepID=A0AA36JFF8_9DINO|nr:unnamed protein product [Effrenium voratum]
MAAMSPQVHLALPLAMARSGKIGKRTTWMSQMMRRPSQTKVWRMYPTPRGRTVAASPARLAMGPSRISSTPEEDEEDLALLEEPCKEGPPAAYQKDLPHKVRRPCVKLNFSKALGVVDPAPVPLPTLPPVTTTWAPAPAPSPATEPALNITVVWEKPRQADTASPDMPQIFIPGTPAPDIDAAAARASERHIEHHKHHKQHKHRVAAHPPPTEDHVEGNASERLPLAPVQNTTWPVDGASEALEGLMLERHRLAEKLLNVSDTFQGQKRRHHGLVKALLVSEDALQNLRAACADHAEASSLVWRELNVTQTKLRRLHGRIRIAKDAARRLEGCVDEDEAAKHANRARWSAEAAMQRAEVEQRLGKLLGMRKRLK